jgi:hypothetical protein
MRIIVLILVLLFGCSTSKNVITDCNINDVQNISDGLMHKKGYDLSSLKSKMKELPDCYIISYFPKDSMTLGGGAEIKVSKKECKVIEMARYQ